MAEFQLISLTEITSSDIGELASFANTYDAIAVAGLSVSVGDIIQFSDDTQWIAKQDATLPDPVEIPQENDAQWEYWGPSDKLKAFDIQVGTDQQRITNTIAFAPSDTEDISFPITAPSTVTGIALFGLKAATVHVIATKDSVTYHDETYTMQNVENYGGSFYRYLHTPPRLQNQIADFSVAIPVGSEVVITISRPGYIAEVASICLGRTRKYGTVADNSAREIVSRSITSNSGLTTTLVRRTPSARTRFEVTLTKSAGEGLYRALEDVDGVAAVFGATDARSDLLTFGFHTNVSRSHLMNGTSRMTIEAEEL